MHDVPRIFSGPSGGALLGWLRGWGRGRWPTDATTRAGPPQAQSISFAHAGPVSSLPGRRFLFEPGFRRCRHRCHHLHEQRAVDCTSRRGHRPSDAGEGRGRCLLSVQGGGCELQSRAGQLLDAHRLQNHRYNAWIGPSNCRYRSFWTTRNRISLARPIWGANRRNYSVCSNGTQTSASASPLTDSVATLQKPTRLTGCNMVQSVTDLIVLPEQKFGPQTNFGSTAFNGRHWLVTGNAEVPRPGMVIGRWIELATGKCRRELSCAQFCLDCCMF